uniref:NADH-ubiquinone oxidoreductase chain 5 n=1 Tax=Bactrurus brachycaudus TaxID=111554 RepID=A0A6C0X7S3_9CRUS|nr:NADH dehydrogenase subunit 5 [Bactrurus brachycaudus]QIC54386.1 NADH dehydrogenase subunit 5 [Bactrurus brachycaudus]
MNKSLLSFSLSAYWLIMGSVTGVVFSMWVLFENLSIILEWGFFRSNGVAFSFSLIFDWMSLVFISTVMVISGVVMLYSSSYMKGDKNINRFWLILLMFVGSMGFLIVSPNLLSLLLGWDGLGLSSYALVIYYQSESSQKAGMITILMNRLGDVGLLVSIGLLSASCGWGFVSSVDLVSGVAILLIILAGVTKSAQIPFSAWLPAAMAAPTPVSALVHSSTLVTAGVYLLIRYKGISAHSSMWEVLMIVSMMTMLMASLGANYESDMKKVIAMSTLSQLGLMMMSLSAGMIEFAFFHLITHAMFKATLFMCAGWMIHVSDISQDLRVFSVSGSWGPFLLGIFNCCNLALCGFPFLSGFFSKDLVLELMLSQGGSMLCSVIVVISSGLTFVYSVRMMSMVVSKESAGSSLSGSGDLEAASGGGMMALFVLSVALGFVMSWIVWPEGSVMLLLSLEKNLVFSVSILMLIVLLLKSDKTLSFTMMVNVMAYMWGLARISSWAPMQWVYKVSGLSIKSMESSWLEEVGPLGGRRVFLEMSSGLQEVQRSMLVSSYFAVSLVTMVVVIVLMS